MTAPLFKPAQRTQAKLRLAIDGPSGSGKTYSAILIAKGLAGGDLSKVALIDTERGSGSLYADLGPYAILDFEPPYSVARYVKAMEAAAAEGFAVIVIDSLTHAWSGEGGILDYVDSVAKAQTSGNSFAAWKQGTPLQKKLFDTMLGSPCHIIATMRSKTEYVIEENERGKKAPRKVGLAPEQRKDAEYEFTLVLDLSREHIATASKDRTGLFDDRLEVPSEKMGAELAAWLGSAKPAPPTPAQRAARREESAENVAATEADAASGGTLADSAPAMDGNGGISEEQRRQLLLIIAGKHRDPSAILAKLGEKGVGDGSSWESLPRVEFDRIAEALDRMSIVEAGPDPEPDPPDEPKSAPLELEEGDFDAAKQFIADSQPVEAPAAAEGQQEAASAAPAAQEDEVPPGHDAASYKARNAELAMREEETKALKGKAPTVTPAQLQCMGAQCAELESLGIGRSEWRTYLATSEGTHFRSLLTKAAATRMIDSLQRWAEDARSESEAVAS